MLVELRLPPKNDPIRLMGMAVHVVRPETARGRTPGVGVQLFGISPEVRARWDKFIMHLRVVVPLPDDAILPEPPPPMVAGLPADHVFDTYRPELRLRFSGPEELDRLSSTSFAKAPLFVRTEVFLAAGTSVWIQLLDPFEDRTHTISAVVIEQVTQPDFIGLAVRPTQLDANGRLILGEHKTEDVYITIDLDEGWIDPPRSAAAG